MTTAELQNQKRVPAENLKAVAFPCCAKTCAFVELMGVGECESVCPEKFTIELKPCVDCGELTSVSRLHRGRCEDCIGQVI